MHHRSVLVAENYFFGRNISTRTDQELISNWTHSRT